MTLPDMLMIAGVEYRRADRDAPEEKDPTDGHQPTPWEWRQEDRDFYDSNGTDVCFGLREKPWAANTRLILRAVNHHANLMAFMEKVICYSIEMDNSGINWPRLVLDAHELLAKVKGT